MKGSFGRIAASITIDPNLSTANPEHLPRQSHLMPQLYPQIGPLLLAAGFQHGFFGRKGGVSQGDYESLNCSYSVGDEPGRVTHNLTLIAGHFGISLEGLLTVNQVHGRRVIDVGESPTTTQIGKTEADALVCTSGDYAIGVRTADCVPVLVGCRDTGAVAAIHAGWRGVVSGVIPETIARLAGKGASVAAMVAAVGPHIGLGAFEVSPDVAHELDSVAPHANAVEWTVGRRPHVRLSRLVASQLMSSGLGPDHIDVIETCTYSNHLELFSFRRDGQRSGRQLSAIRPQAI
jgi:YfiH family protein